MDNDNFTEENLPIEVVRRRQAEADLLELVRRQDAQNFRVTIECRNGDWTVTTVDLDAIATDPPSDTCIGEGETFEEAWHGQAPTWTKS